MIYQLSRSRKFNLLLIASFVFAILIIPGTAHAGILGKVLNTVRPFAKFAGKIAGAVAGASLGAAFMPPLGMLAGGIAGWIVGGIVTSYATGSLSNLAALGGATLGVMALSSFGPVGYVAGALMGGFLGKMAMSLLYKADREATGGILFMTDKPATSAGSSPGVALAPEIPMAYDNSAVVPVTENTAGDNVNIAPTSEEISKADKEYRSAYQLYINATREGKNVSEAHKAYLQAFDNYKKLTGKDPQ